MGWREELRRVSFNGRDFIGASFRGAPFFVDEAEMSGGRRTVEHQFPLRNKAFVEDLGQRNHHFTVTGYVIGDDYLSQKRALQAALDGVDVEGPGTLVHPYEGQLTAICDTYSVRERRGEGAFATFTINFIETPAQAPSPAIEVDTAGRVATSADAAITASKAELVAKYDTAGLPSSALASAETALKNAAAGLQAKLAPAVRAAEQLASPVVRTAEELADAADSVTQQIATLGAKVRILTAQASSLVRQPAELFDSFRGAINSLADAAEAAPGAVMDALVEAYGIDLGRAVPEITRTRRRERANQLALTGALRQVIAVEAARLAPLVPYKSIEDATTARGKVVALLDDLALTAGDTAYPTIVTLRSDVMRAIPGSRALARVITIELREPIPVDVLAYRLYGSVDLADDIIARNKIRHPLFVSGVLKVLSNGN